MPQAQAPELQARTALLARLPLESLQRSEFLD